MICIGNPESTFIGIEPLGQFNTQEWGESIVQIRTGCFQGAIKFWFDLDDFKRFHKELIELNTTLKGVANFNPTEEQFVLKLEGNGLGKISVSGIAYEMATYGSNLKFEFEIDQTYLEPIIRGVESYVLR
jgi:hypothetical protein